MSVHSGSSGGPSEAIRAAADRIERRRREAVERASKAMASTAGWQGAAKAAAAQAVLEATMAECRDAVGEVVEALVRAGERDPAAAAHVVRRDLFDRLEPPGLGFFSGSSPEAAGFTPALADHRAEFKARLDALERDLSERFAAAPEPKPVSRRSLAARFGSSPVLFWFLVVTSVLSLLGVSWLRLIERAASAVVGP